MKPLGPSALYRLGWPLAILSFFLVAVVAYFLPALVEDKLLGPSDGLSQNLPARLLVAAAWRSGELPFWNPYIFSGTPLLATIHPGVFFPGNWPFWVLPPYWAYNVTLMGAFWIAGVGAYACARALALPRLSSLVAGLTFMFGGFFVMHVAHLQMLQAAALLPWLLWAVARFLGTERAGYAVGGSLLLALQILAGHPQMTAYSALLVGAYGLWRLCYKPAPARWRLGGQLGLMFALGIGVSLLQLLPTLDLIGLSHRKAISFAWLTQHSLHVSSLPAFLSPYLFGASSPSHWLVTPIWGNPDMMGFSEGYPGLGALLLAALAVFRWRRAPAVRFFAVAAALSLVLAMGKHTPLYQLWAQLPVVKMMPYAGRHLMVFTFTMGLLAAYGLAGFERGPSTARARQLAVGLAMSGLAVGGVLLAVGFLGPAYAAKTQPLLPPDAVDLTSALHLSNPGLWVPIAVWLGLAAALVGLRRRAAAAAGLLLLVVVGDLYLFGQHQHVSNPEVPATLRYRQTFDWTAGRVMAIRSAPYANPYFDAWGSRSYAQLEGLRVNNLAMLSGVPAIRGYDAFTLTRYGEFLQLASYKGDGETIRGVWNPESHLLDLLGLKTVYFEPGVEAREAWKQHLTPDRWTRLPDEGAMRRFENRRALPRAWRVDRVAVLPAEQVDQRVRHDGDFEPRHEALLEAAPSRETWSPGTAEAETVSLNRIRLATEGAGPGLVLVSESYDPGWRAFAGGRELPVHRADALIMAVEVPAGKQEVELRYEPRLWRWGLAGSGLSLLAVGLWGGLARRRRRRASV